MLEGTREKHGFFETAENASKLTLHLAEAIPGLPNPQQQQQQQRDTR
jgi:hypothetical protein